MQGDRDGVLTDSRHFGPVPGDELQGPGGPRLLAGQASSALCADDAVGRFRIRGPRLRWFPQHEHRLPLPSRSRAAAAPSAVGRPLAPAPRTPPASRRHRRGDRVVWCSQPSRWRRLISRPHQLSETAGRDYSFILPARRRASVPLEPVRADPLRREPGGRARRLGRRHHEARCSGSPRPPGSRSSTTGPATRSPRCTATRTSPRATAIAGRPVLIAWVTPSQTDIPFDRNGQRDRGGRRLAGAARRSAGDGST